MTLLIYRFVFLLTDTAETMNAAQAARLGHISYRRHMKSLGLLIANLMPRAFARAQALEIGLAARGWHGELRVLSSGPPGLASGDRRHSRTGACSAADWIAYVMSLLEARCARPCLSRRCSCA